MSLREGPSPIIDITASGVMIRRYLDLRGVEIKELAERMNVKPSTIYKWLEGRRIPSIDNLVALSYYLETPMDSLIVSSVPPMKPIKFEDSTHTGTSNSSQSLFILFNSYGSSA